MNPPDNVELLDAKHPRAARQQHKDKAAAHAFLKNAARNKRNMAHFTELWTKLRPSRLKSREIKDQDVLTGLAGLMAEGKLRLMSRPPAGGAAPAGGGSGGSASSASASPAQYQRAREMREPGLKIRERPDPKPLPPPPAPIDVARQIEALLAAAKSGVPFVEQCEKAR